MPRSPTHPWVDGARSPLFVLTIPRKRPEGELQRAMDTVHNICRISTGPIAWIVDGSALIGGTASERKILVDNEKRNAQYAHQFNIATAIVAPTKVVQGLYMAITWLAPPVYPTQLVLSMAEAEAWVGDRLLERGVQLAPLIGSSQGFRPSEAPPMS